MWNAHKTAIHSVDLSILILFHFLFSWKWNWCRRFHCCFSLNSLENNNKLCHNSSKDFAWTKRNAQYAKKETFYFSKRKSCWCFFLWFFVVQPTQILIPTSCLIHLFPFGDEFKSGCYKLSYYIFFSCRIPVSVHVGCSFAFYFVWQFRSRRPSSPSILALISDTTKPSFAICFESFCNLF